MYASAFEYYAPTTVAEAVKLLDQHGDGAKIVTGGMSLVPLMKLRLAQPSHLIDLRKVPGLTGVTESGGELRIGALTTHAAVAASPVVRAKFAMMAEEIVRNPMHNGRTYRLDGGMILPPSA